MRAVLQRVSSAAVDVDGQTIGRIESGLLILLGVERGDNEADAKYLADKTIGLRIFQDADNKMNLSLLDAGGQALVVSQFTLCGDVRKGRRPSFIKAADPETGKLLYERYVDLVAGHGVKVATGQFQADMQVSLVNDGPVTILLDSNKTF